MNIRGEIENYEWNIKTYRAKIQTLEKQIVGYSRDITRAADAIHKLRMAESRGEIPTATSFDEYGNYGENNPPVGDTDGTSTN